MALQITAVKGSGLNVADNYGANPQNASPCIRLICPTLEFADKVPQRDSSAMSKAAISRQALRAAANSGTEMWVSLNKKNGGGYAGQLVVRIAQLKSANLKVADILGTDPQNASPCIRLSYPGCPAPGFVQSKCLLVQQADQSFADQFVRFNFDARMDPITFEFADKDPKRSSAAMGKGTVSRHELNAALNAGTEKWIQLNKKSDGSYAGELCIRVSRYMQA
ncbi:hypothetical protein AMAG_18800 [Allomyces macrogynus ATCC 38327]|uniref:C2 domain-containing protein n=1 Tax=Allomyces macrogynus (strain ATCC 38327) TaxID=578462 RepID=A0A0L0SHW0_ALLM3|nr:hypothetical protein AMAG_18800 [Allomyces macrogynus ATCC 38327]|eukprot:KNE62029.1 hypothetical protein AMAG_18800 [Allomyces macrogynus ATCC 38327]